MQTDKSCFKDLKFSKKKKKKRKGLGLKYSHTVEIRISSSVVMKLEVVISKARSKILHLGNTGLKVCFTLNC